MIDKKVTIYDVARAAGVSKGTVDRVVYGRGRVSAESAEKVNRAISELGYTPNVYAISLASRKSRVIACLVPQYATGTYWEKIHDGFETAQDLVKDLGIRLKFFYYDDNSLKSFSQCCAQILEEQPDAAIVRPLMESKSKAFVEALHSKNIPYVYLDNHMPDENCLAYYGVDYYKSGYLGGYLLTDCGDVDGAPVDSILILRVKRDPKGITDPTRLRREGLLAYIDEHFPSCKIYTEFLEPNDEDDRMEVLDRFFAAHPEVKHVAVTNSRVFYLSDYLAKNPREGMRIVGFDDLPNNTKALQKGLVTFIITRRIAQQPVSCVQTLADFLIRGIRPQKQDNFMHMDILTRYNQDNY